MATADSTDGSVDDFLQRIRELGDKRDREDEERTRKLEQDILAGKQARQARRAERARSLSPEKDSPSITPKSLHRTMGLMDSPSLTPRTRYKDLHSDISSVETPEKQPAPSLASTLVFPGQSTTKTENSPLEESETSEAVNEAPRLSWQRRPPSTIRRERPVTMYARHSNFEDSADNLTRDDIQKSLESKDIDFFKQTEDKISSSVRSKSALMNDDQTEKVQLPGLNSLAKPTTDESVLEEHSSSRKEESESGRNTPDDYRRRDISPSPSRTSAILSNQAKRKSMYASINLQPKSVSDLSEVSSRDAAIEEAENALRQPAMSPSQTRIGDRAPSQTKGFGGFVQSAMLKREGSINKRWGPTPSGANLSRNNTTASTRPVSFYSTRPIDIHALSQESSSQVDDKDKSPEGSESTKRGETPEPRSVRNRKSSFIEGHSRKYSFADAPFLSKDKDNSDLSFAPSRTFDQKRWSPTKSTWLESALRKSSEPPAPRGTAPPPKPLLPLDPLRKPPAFEARPPEKTHERKHSEVQPLPAPPAFSVKPRSKTVSNASQNTISSTSTPKLTPVLRSKTPVEPEPAVEPKKESPKMEAPKAVFEKPAPREPSPTETPVLSKSPVKPPIGPKPIDRTVKQIDFRGVLKPRSADKGDEKKEEAPFVSVMQRLKSTKQNTYVPKNEFREQLASGKQQLTQTGGPQKSNRVDPLKESVLTAKASLRRGTTSTSSPDLRRGSISSAPSPEKEFVPKPLATSRTFAPSTTVKPLTSPPPAAEKPVFARPTSQTRTFAPSKSMTPSGPSSEAAKAEEETASSLPARSLRSSSSSITSPTFASPSLSTKPGIPSLKDRMNPNLAALLQRGPGAPKAEAASTSDATSSPSAQTEEPRGKELSHMTKGRARGPKRRAPTKVAGAEIKKDVEQPRETAKAVEIPKQVRQEVVVEPTPVKVVAPEPAKTRPEITRKSSDVVKSTTPRESQSPVAERKPQSPEAHKTPLAATAGNVIGQAADVVKDVAKDLNGSIEEALKNLTVAPKPQEQQTQQQSPKTDRELPKLPRKFSFEMEDDRSLPAPPAKERELPPLPARKPSVASLSPSIDGKKSPPAISPKPSFSHLGSEPGSPLSRVVSPSSPPALPAKPSFSRMSSSSSLSSAITLDRKDSTSFRSVEPLQIAPETPPKPLTLTQLQRNPSLSMKNIRKPSIRQPNVETIPEPLISKKPEEIESEYANVRTLKFTIWEITADGKKTAMPLNQEHIFYDECMYIALHHLEIEGEGESYEVYLWVGDKVPEPAIEDVQIFGRQLAREKNTQLILTKQNNEPPRFLQAIGWIFLVLSGRSPSSSSQLNLTTSKLLLKAIHKYEGVIFTQVPTTKAELTSGNPFLYSNGQGKKLWLWKGKDATAEDVGVARLVAFDLAGGGDVEEEIEGMERQGWNQAFGGQA